MILDLVEPGDGFLFIGVKGGGFEEPVEKLFKSDKAVSITKIFLI